MLQQYDLFVNTLRVVKEVQVLHIVFTAVAPPRDVVEVKMVRVKHYLGGVIEKDPI